MLDRDCSAPSTSSGSSDHDEIELERFPTSEPGTSTAVEPKSAIDVALELIAQEELEAINAARMAALNKPKPRGRPPLSRKIVESAANTNTKKDSSQLRLPIKGKELERSQLDAPHIAVLLKDRAEELNSATSPLPILKDHLEVEAAARSEPQSMEVSLFGADNCEPESTDFHKMVLLHYGSVDGRLVDDDEDSEEGEEVDSFPQWNNSQGVLPPRKDSAVKKGLRKSEENLPEMSDRDEVAVPVSLRVHLSPSDGACSTIKEQKSTLASMETEEISEPTVAAPPTIIKRRTYEKKGRGRPRKSREAGSPAKSSRPRGRPRKDGGDSIQKSERKSVERDLPDGQVIALQPVYPTPTPHPIVYRTTPASSMPTVTQPGDDEDSERPSTAPTATFSTQSQHSCPHGQGRPMYGYYPPPYPAGAYPSYPPQMYHVVPAPVMNGVSRKLHEHLQKRRPRRAAAMIQDFLELYAKVDLADLEFVHARATTFVKMLVDEYVEESKANTTKSASHSDTQSSRGTGSEAAERKGERKAGLGNKNNLHYFSRRRSSVDMDVTGSSAVDDVVSAEEPESSTEEIGPEGGYDSSSDPSGEFGEESRIRDVSIRRSTSLTDSFIDSIPVIRGAVLQQLPTVVDSA